jgi:L-lysine exporter family protein LysE/ArgO
MEIIYALIKGFFTSSGLIIAIGAQNAFVIRQGILRQHLFLTAFLCSFLDSCLIFLGVLGFGKLLDNIPGLLSSAKYFAIVYLLFYGAASLKSALNQKSAKNLSSLTAPTLKKTILLILALTLLNPHAYLDTVVLLGSVAAQEEPHVQNYFALGAIIASFSWFFSLSYGSTFLGPWLGSARGLKILDLSVAFIMWLIAALLTLSLA